MAGQKRRLLLCMGIIMAFKEKIIGDCRLILGDCLSVMSTLDKVDAVVTDPPYLLTSGGGNGSHLGGCLSNDKYDNKGDIVPCDISWKEIAGLCFNALKNSGNAYIMSNNRNMEEALKEIRLSGFKLHNILVWDKKTVTPNRFYMNRIEFCIFVYKQKSRYIKDMGLDNLFSIHNKKGSGHPTEKPVDLIRCWVEQSSDITETILDPFMGSGTTGVACAKLGRKFIGIEIEEKWFDLACKRIEEAYRQSDMFIEPPMPESLPYKDTDDMFG